MGNLPNDTTEEQFRALFTPYGELSEVFVNPSRGFGFVRLVSTAHVIFLKLPVLFNDFVALFHHADAVIVGQNDSSRVGDGVHFEGLKSSQGATVSHCLVNNISHCFIRILLDNIYH